MIGPFAGTRVTTRQIYALGSLAAILFGYDNGIIGAAILFIPHDLPLSPWMLGAVVSSMVVGAMIGALGSGRAADRLGRQRMLFVAGLAFTVGASGSGLAPSVSMLVAGRFVVGLAIGIASVLVPIYLAEMAPAADRGVATSLNQYMIIVGTGLAAAIGYGLAFVSSWRWMLLLGVFPGVVLMIGMLRMPDTPRSLVRRGHAEQARALLAQLRGDDKAAASEFAEITALDKAERDRPSGTRLSEGWVRQLVLLGVLLAVFQQITGINTIVYYAPKVLTEFGVSSTSALLFGVINGVVNIGTIAVVVRSKVVDRRGRKPMLLVGLVGMSASLLGVGIAAWVFPVSSTALFVIVMAALVLFTNTFSATWGPVLWVMLAEMFPLAVRGTAMAIATLFNWLANFVVALTFPALTQLAGMGTIFVAYALVGVVVFPVVALAMPETKQRSLEALEAAFRGGTRLR